MPFTQSYWIINVLVYSFYICIDNYSMILSTYIYIYVHNLYCQISRGFAFCGISEFCRHYNPVGALRWYQECRYVNCKTSPKEHNLNWAQNGMFCVFVVCVFAVFARSVSSFKSMKVAGNDIAVTWSNTTDGCLSTRNMCVHAHFSYQKW